jgi:hypothetical protein
VESQFIKPSPYTDGNRIRVSLINMGRRDITVRLYGGTTSDGKWSGSYLGDNGVKLGEHERHEFYIEKEDVFPFDLYDEDVMELEFMWVEDSVGKRYEIPNSREYIKQLRA